MAAFDATDMNAQADALAQILGIGVEQARQFIDEWTNLANLPDINKSFSVNSISGATRSSGGGSTTGSGRSSAILGGSGRALGGPVRPGVPFTVGERGRETFVPSEHGTIIPNGGMGGGTNITVNVGGSVISEGELVDRIRQSLRNETIRGGSLEFA
jgi:hypothetical protein